MKCSEKNFLTSQALYGLMIAHPKWKRKKLIKRAVKFAEALLEKDSPKTIRMPRTTRSFNTF